MLAFNKKMPAGIHNHHFTSIVQELQKAFVFLLIAMKDKVGQFCFKLQDQKGKENRVVKDWTGSQETT